ncbi:hypothetical protein GCM10010411_72420 [Actinomadura fulvescens]|uniref:Uncharacterized protein n=1 Tax=Actinomadura fulvescens TaxID=46160 RepID=A0ABN3QFR7_9ACTN
MCGDAHAGCGGRAGKQTHCEASRQGALVRPEPSAPIRRSAHVNVAGRLTAAEDMVDGLAGALAGALNGSADAA